MGDNWGSNNTSGSSGGHGVGRGRGFIGKPAETTKSAFGATTDTTATTWNGGANNNNSDNWNNGSSRTFDQNRFQDATDDGWDEPSNTTSTGSGWNSGGGGNYASGGGGGGGRACHKCGEEGHMARDCSSGGAKKSVCSKCSEEGHMSRECPNGGGQSRGGSCYKCGEEGHMSRECPNGGGDKKGGSGCFKCGEEGHMSRECPNPRSDNKRGGSGCFRCGEDGHISKDCPTGGGDGQKRSGCFKCGEDGHISKECPNADKTRTTIGEDGKPREIYVPPELTEDENELFQGVPTGINFEKYDNIKVDVGGSNVPKPILTFVEAGFSPTLNENISKAKYTKPTPVQKYTIPIIRAGRDLMACAQTGSGKTAAFLLPIIQAMFEASDLPNNTYANTQEPWAIIVSPTRELAIQIHQEAAKFSLRSIVKAALIYGGTSTSVQSNRLSKGAHILVATPGRLHDFVEKGKVSFAQVRYFILDEADRMLDMGFGPKVREMVEHSSMPDKSTRQTLLFSATFPPDIQKMAAEFLKPDYLFLRVGVVGAANVDVTQTVLQVPKFEKKDKLLQILKESGDNDRTLVFVETKRQADFVASLISQKGFSCTSIHGDRLQREREEALNDFRAGRRPILTATAVAARGLDIRDVRHVINYDMPSTIDEYVHRIGRTGRVGNTGQSTSFYDPDKDSPLASELIRILADAQQEVPDWLESMSSGGFSGGSNFTSRDVRGSSKSTWENDTAVANGDESWD